MISDLNSKMSSWKNASKANQKTHKERHQPEERKHLGLLEKKKDYIKRAKDYNRKQKTLKTLRQKALNKNPDEFYFHMINAKIDNGVHHEKEKRAEDTPEQLVLMRGQDLKYIRLKRNQEKKKIEKLQAQLHLISVDKRKKNTHIYFEGAPKSNETDQQLQSAVNLSESDLIALGAASEKSKHLYEQLAKRINREKELAIIQEKLEMQKHIDGKKSAIPPKKVKKATANRAPVYKWQYERKK